MDYLKKGLAETARLPQTVVHRVSSVYETEPFGKKDQNEFLNAVAEIAAAVVTGEQKALPAQVVLDGEWLDLHGVVGAPVILTPDGWEHIYPIDLDADEVAALARAVDAIAAANSAVTK